jgi:hypothetical protein
MIFGSGSGDKERLDPPNGTGFCDFAFAPGVHLDRRIVGRVYA